MRNFALKNLNDVLSVIFYQPGIKRSEISDKLSMAAATVSKYTEILIHKNIVQEALNTRGRNVALTVNPSWKTTLGVDIGGSLIRIGRLSSDGVFNLVDEFATPEDASALLATIQHHAASADALGIAVTAVVNPNEHRIVIFPNQRTWDGLDFSQMSIEKLMLTTSGSAAAIWEKKFGALKGMQNCMHINVGHGIQAGLFINNELVAGANHAAGELGHVFSTADAGICSCGNVGCLENVVTIPMIIRWIRERVALHPDVGVVSELCNGDLNTLDLEKIRSAYRAQDPFTVSSIQQTAAAFATALSGIVNVLNPQAISLGGRLAEVFPEILPEIHSAIAKKALQTNVRNLSVVRSAMPLYGACAGAALLPMEKFLDVSDVE